MLLLTLQAAGSRYAIDVARVVEVVPRINLRHLPHAPISLSGVFDYRGTVVPVVDLGILLGSESCRDRLSTRIVLVNSHPSGAEQASTALPAAGNAAAAAPQRRWLLGLVAEQVSDVSSITPEQVISAAMQLPVTPYLGAIVEIGQEMVQLIQVDQILDDTLRRSFFGLEAASAQVTEPGGSTPAGTI